MTTQNNSTENDTKYYDLTTHARMFPHFARTIKADRGPNYDRLNVSAAFGKVGQDTLTYVFYDLKIVGEKTTAEYMAVKEAINDKNKTVRMQGIIGDAEPEIQEYDGKQKVVMKGRLMKIVWCAVDGELVIDNRRNSDDQTTQASGESEQQQTPSQESVPAGQTAANSQLPPSAPVNQRFVG